MDQPCKMHVLGDNRSTHPVYIIRISLLVPVDPLSIESQSRDGSLVAYDKGKGNDKSPKRPARAVKHKEAMPAAGFLFEIASSSRRAKKVFFEFEDLQATAGQRGRGGVEIKSQTHETIATREFARVFSRQIFAKGRERGGGGRTYDDGCTIFSTSRSRLERRMIFINLFHFLIFSVCFKFLNLLSVF